MSNHKFTVVHRVDQNNVGDLASNPLQYFLKPDEYQVVDITKINETPYNSNLPMVVGGGGLIANKLFGDALLSLLPAGDLYQLIKIQQQAWKLQDYNNKKVHSNFVIEYTQLIKDYIGQLLPITSNRYIWGAGHNSKVNSDNNNNTYEFIYPDYLEYFNKVGIRDWNTNHSWVPCASCMHPALYKKYAIKNDVVFFEHKKQLIKDFGVDSIPRFINSGSNIDQTIELLGSANIILTNSYHGAYWGVLLGKKVIVVDAWSSKFLSMKHTPWLLPDTRDWKAAIDNVTIYNNALDECRVATEEFWEKIK
jgi:hypothetical protein